MDETDALSQVDRRGCSPGGHGNVPDGEIVVPLTVVQRRLTYDLIKDAAAGSVRFDCEIVVVEHACAVDLHLRGVARRIAIRIDDAGGVVIAIKDGEDVGVCVGKADLAGDVVGHELRPDGAGRLRGEPRQCEQTEGRERVPDPCFTHDGSLQEGYKKALVSRVQSSVVNGACTLPPLLSDESQRGFERGASE